MSLFGKIDEWKRSSGRFQNKASKGHCTMQNAILNCVRVCKAVVEAGCVRLI